MLQEANPQKTLIDPLSHDIFVVITVFFIWNYWIYLAHDFSNMCQGGSLVDAFV